MHELLSPLLLKSLHIIFVVTWFAGLFYIVRLFIYHVEAQDKTEPATSILSSQYKIMEKRLWYIITWPSMIFTLIIASLLRYSKPVGFMMQNYMLLKLGFVGVLVVYHIGCHKIYKELQQNTFKYSSMQLRLWNEVATLLLFIIVFLIVYKSLDFYKGIAGFGALVVILMLGIKWYKKSRTKTD
jgi:putative membrane protein